MIVSNRFGFVFVHVPKAAGSTVREQLSDVDPEAVTLWGRKKHEVLGDIDLAHLPLTVLRDHFPEYFQAVNDFPSYALVRDPDERFASSISQHVKVHQRRSVRDLSEQELRRTVERVLETLGSSGPALPAMYAHFTPQSQFVELDGEALVHAYAVEHLSAMFEVLSSLTGRRLDASARANQGFTIGSTEFDRFARAVNSKLWSVLPLPVYRGMRRGLAPILEGTQRGSTRQPAAGLSQEVTSFVHEFYAEDFRLHRSLLRQP